MATGLEAGRTRSPKAYAYKQDGKWYAGRDYPGKDKGDLLRGTPDIKVKRSEKMGIYFQREKTNQLANRAEINRFKKAKGLEGYSYDKSAGRWRRPDGTFISQKDVYKKLKYTSDEIGKAKSQVKRRQKNNFVTGLMDTENISEGEARRRVDEFTARRKEIRKNHPPEEQQQLINQAMNDILYD